MFTLSKKLIAILFSLAFALSLGACSDQSAVEGTAEEATATEQAAEPAEGEESTQQ